MILLTGITGNNGGATATALLKRGVKFRALVRDLDKAQSWADQGVELVQGDLNDPASVAAALEGCDKAVLVLPNGEDQERLELQFIEVAQQSDIKHFIKLSSPEAIPGTKSPIPLAHIAAENAIKASGMNWTLVRPSFFMQNLTGYAHAAKASGKLSMPMGNGTVALTDCADAGEFIAMVLTTGPEEHFGKSGGYYHHVVRGIHTSEVKPHRIPKSVGAERTFSENLSSEIFMLERLENIANELERRLRKSKISGKTVTLKIKYSDFTLQTRSKTLPYFISEKALILETAKELLYQSPMQNSVRLLGISLANLKTEKKDPSQTQKEETVSVQLKFDF